MKGLLSLALWAPCTIVSAQMPDGWSSAPTLGAGFSQGQTWYGAGIWAADKNGPPAPFVQSLGLGNALVGTGISLEAGRIAGPWEVAGKVLLYKDTEGNSSGTLQQAHMQYRTSGGWLWALEKEPLVWGYGLNGGYVLGEAARPFPKFRMETPFRELSLLGIPLGTWKGEFFWGKLESQRSLGDEVQDASYRSRVLASDPQGPFLSGLRAEARIGDDVELYLNWINLFGGTVQGVPMTAGYNLADWITAMLGAKDSLAEGNNLPSDPNAPQGHTYKNKARSASTSDVGVRLRSVPMARLLAAQEVRFYITRGSKAVNTLFGSVYHQPLYTLSQDVQQDWRAVRDHALRRIWDKKYRYWAPSPEVPNDVIGVLMTWERFRLGLEYLDTSNEYAQFKDQPSPNGHRSFVSSTYRTGFYYHGDALGTALGGEARVATLRAEWDVDSCWALQVWLHRGDRPFRDVTADWVLDHPGREPGFNRFFGVQPVVAYHGKGGLAAKAGLSFQHQTAVDYQAEVPGNGVRWFLELGWRWGT